MDGTYAAIGQSRDDFLQGYAHRGHHVSVEESETDVRWERNRKRVTEPAGMNMGERELAQRKCFIEEGKRNAHHAFCGSVIALAGFFRRQPRKGIEDVECFFGKQPEDVLLQKAGSTSAFTADLDEVTGHLGASQELHDLGEEPVPFGCEHLRLQKERMESGVFCAENIRQNGHHFTNNLPSSSLNSSTSLNSRCTEAKRM